MMLHYQIWGCILSLLLFSTSAECKSISAQEYLNRIKAAVESRDTVTISENVQTLCKKYPDSSVTLVALLLEGNFAQDVSGDSKHAKVCYEKIASSDERSTVVAAGRIALADMAWHGAFKKSIADYEAILKDFPGLSLIQHAHINSQLGLFHWQLREKDKAREKFLQVVNATTGDNNDSLPIAKIHLDAFKSTQSISMMLVLYDRAMRWRDSRINRDLCWKDLARFLELASLPFFEKYCTDETIGSELRAALLYKLALANFELGNHDIIPQITQRALDLKPTGSTKQKLLYIQAYHHAHCQHYEHASMIYRQILEGPTDMDVTPNAYWELSKILNHQGDRSNALKLMQEFSMLYPYRIEAQKFKDDQQLHQNIDRQYNTASREELQSKLGKETPETLNLSNDTNVSKIHVMEVAK